MWIVSKLRNRLDAALVDRSFKTEMADKPHLPIWRSFVNVLLDFYLLHWQWVWSSIIAFVGLYLAVLALK
jgi:hypothetical protein